MAKGQPLKARKVMKTGSPMGPPIPTGRSQMQPREQQQQQPQSVATPRQAPPLPAPAQTSPMPMATSGPLQPAAPAPVSATVQPPAAPRTLEDRIRGGEFGTQGPTKTWDPAAGVWRLPDGSVAEAPRGVTVTGDTQPGGPPLPTAPTTQPMTIGPAVAGAFPVQAPAQRALPSNQELFDGQLSVADVQRAVYERGYQQLRPHMEAQARRMAQSLVDRGIPVGSEAYRLEMDRFENAQHQALADLSMRAVQAGAQEQSRRIGILQSLRGQEFGEMDANRRFGASRTDADRAYGLARDQFGEGQRRFDLGHGLAERQFGEGARRFDLGFGEDRRRYDQGFAEGLRRYEYGTEEDRRRYDQEWASSEQARQFQQEMALRGMNLQELSTRAQIAMAREKANLDALLAAGVITQQQHDREMQEEYLRLRQRESDVGILTTLGGGVSG